nr:immunoglobulin light chain junction region [Macaca mulatta]
LYQYFSGYSF